MARRATAPTPPGSWTFHWWTGAGCVYYVIGAQELVENPSNLHLVTPAIAALAGYAITRFSSVVAARSSASLAVALVLVAIVAWRADLHRRMHDADDRAYRLGLALREISEDGDLMAVLGQTIGCPAALYYSGRRGWLFPAFEQITDWYAFPPEDEAIRFLEELRARGASLIGMVGSRRDEIWRERPAFASYLESTARPLRDDETAIVYRLAPAPDGAGIREQ